MNTLIVYDAEGYIVQMITGNYRVPVGIPYLEVEVPEGKLVAGVNVTVVPRVPIYTDAPASEVKTLEDRVSLLEDAFNASVGI